MARPISWLPRLHEIRRSVAGSVRSHYTQQDLERLFALKPRAASKMLEMLPTVTVGRAVEREALAKFLESVHAADDTSAAVRRAREEKMPAPRRAIRSLVQRDDSPAELEGIPEYVSLNRGRLEVNFRTAAELAEAMYWMAKILADDVRKMFEELEKFEGMMTKK
jgi:aminoglycoside phosphotransferase (APT) family kinase protein